MTTERTAPAGSTATRAPTRHPSPSHTSPSHTSPGHTSPGHTSPGRDPARQTNSAGRGARGGPRRRPGSGARGLLAAAAFAVPLASCGDDGATEAREKPPLVLMVVVDTLRADHLGAYGHDAPTSPQIDAFAERAVRFENAFAPTSWTKPSVPSLLTGRMPSSHGVFEGNSKDAQGRITSDVLPDDVVTLAETMRAAGYATGGFVKNAHLKPFLGFAQGFDRYEEGIGDAEAIHREFLTWLDQRLADRPDQPVFAWLHVLDVHWPYLPPPGAADALPPRASDLDLTEAGQKELRDRVNDGELVLDESQRAALRSLYDTCIRGYDQRFGLLLRALEGRGLLDDALIVFTSDHGEEFGERGKLGHGHSLHDDLLRIPLIVRLPRDERAGTVATPIVSLTDVFPTLAGFVGAPIPDEVTGVDLLARLPDEAQRDAAAMAELMHGRAYTRAVRTPSWKLIEDYRYVAGADPAEAIPDDAAPTGSPAREGMRVEIKGRVKRGELEGERVTFEDSDDDDVELRGPIDEIDVAKGVLRIGPFTIRVDVDDPIEVRDGAAIAFAELAVGDVIDVDCEEFDGDVAIADDLELRPDKAGSRSIKVEGIVGDVDDDELRIGPYEVALEDDATWEGFAAVARAVPERRIPLEALVPEVLSDPRRFEHSRALFDLRADPEESADVQSGNDPIVEHLTRRLRVLRSSQARTADAAVLDEETLRELEQAGYLGGGD